MNTSKNSSAFVTAAVIVFAIVMTGAFALMSAGFGSPQGYNGANLPQAPQTTISTVQSAS